MDKREFKPIGGNTFSQWLSDSSTSELGDSKESVFLPQVKSMHWGNEANFSLRLYEDAYTGKLSVNEKTGIIEYNQNGKISRFYKKQTSDEMGGYEFEIEFPEKPESMTVNYTIKSKALAFYRQEVTPQMADIGFKMSDAVKGSYAVYHKSKRHNEYKTGKAFHLHRPEVIDANGKRAYCSWLIDKDAMTIVMPSDFMDQAVYPVILDPTFGQTNIGATDYTTSRGLTTRFQTPEAGTLNSITAYIKSTGDATFKAGLYSNLVTVPNALLTTGAGGAINTTEQWRTQNVTNYGFLGSVQLWPALICDDFLIGYWDSGPTGQSAEIDPEFGTNFDDPAVVNTPLDAIFSIYGTYTASANNNGMMLVF